MRLRDTFLRARLAEEEERLYHTAASEAETTVSDLVRQAAAAASELITKESADRDGARSAR